MQPHKLVQALLEWFRASARDLPWRRTRDPYAIWVSEIMLQQTQVKTVLPYWERWMQAMPNVGTLARAESGKLHKLWEGLGYYTRVRNLQKAAQVILAEHDGKFPSEFEAILALPGIGRYTAGAISSIAFNQPKPILDGNVMRVLTRICSISGDPRDKAVNARLWQLAEELVLQAAELAPLHASRTTPSCSALNQSLMELGALICTARSPQCALCPVAKHCSARLHERVEDFPHTIRRAQPTARRFAAFVVAQDGCVLARQRPPGVVNGHLWEFPNIELSLDDTNLKRAARQTLGMAKVTLSPLCTLKHTITRYRIQLEAYRVTAARMARNTPQGSEWLSLSQLRRLPFTSAHKKILQQLS
jgi:A/G-specific adenine glycosylase